MIHVGSKGPKEGAIIMFTTSWRIYAVATGNIAFRQKFATKEAAYQYWCTLPERLDYSYSEFQD